MLGVLDRIISGGQTGADQAGLAAARYCGLKTGGFAPKGWKTSSGPQPKLKEYNLVEHSSENYKERTWSNVNASDATLRLAKDFSSAGERCTLNAIKKFNKPYLDIEIPISTEKEEYLIKTVVCWLKRHKVKTLNIAGNSEKTAPGIYNEVSKFLVKVFERINDG